MALYMNDDTTAVALQHRFRSIKKDAAAMIAAIAGSYQQGITGEGAATHTPAKGTPRNRDGGKKATPKATMAANGNGTGGSDDDEGSDFATPSKKKDVLNKTKGGRVTKGKGKGRGMSQSFDEDDEDLQEYVKPEPSTAAASLNEYDNNDGLSMANGNGHYGGGGYGNSDAANFSFEDGEGQYYDDDEEVDGI